MFYHVAKHARRSVNPPDDTWVAFANNKRGYKKHPHFQIGLWETHVFIWFAMIYEAPNKAEFGKKVEEKAVEIRSLIPDHFVWSGDHTKPDATPFSSLSQEQFVALSERVQNVKKAELLCGLHLDREKVISLTGDELLKKIKDEDEKNRLQQVAEKWSLPMTDEHPQALAMIIEEGKLAVKNFAEPKQLGVFVDFMSGSSLYRQQYGGGKKEPIARAIGVKGAETPTVLDATPGLGRDAFVLASTGCRVVMMERSPVVAALLDDGLERLAQADPEFSRRFRLIHGNSIECMESLDEEIDAVYLDPMFPHRKKSALVKKEMRVFQQLLGSDDDADGLLAPARALARQRVVVKRPAYAEPLAKVSPTMAIESKKHRFDVYLSPK